MSNINAEHNRVVWFDIPVANLERAQMFYHAVLAKEVALQTFGDFEFCLIEHGEGNGGCLCVNPGDISDKGVMIYMNVNGRIRHAVEQVPQHDGKVIQDVHPIGPHGFRAVVLDSEGNRLALHSYTDA